MYSKISIKVLFFNFFVNMIFVHDNLNLALYPRLENSNHLTIFYYYLFLYFYVYLFIDCMAVQLHKLSILGNGLGSPYLLEVIVLKPDVALCTFILTRPEASPGV